MRNVHQRDDDVLVVMALGAIGCVMVVIVALVVAVRVVIGWVQ